MRLFYFGGVLRILIYTGLSSSQTVYITDLPVYKALAPCASNAISYVVQGLTDSKCPALVTSLASCACTKDTNSASIASRIASSVLYSCGSTATEDIASASVAFSAYCNQATPYAVATASAGAVSKYITALPAFSDLGPCAGTALSYAVAYLTNNKCPPGASALQSCACTKNQISLALSGSISSSVAYQCGTTHTEDIASAQAVFAGYCGLAQGSSNFPSPSYLAGNINYYITALPQFSALAKCAQSAVSYPIQIQTNRDCPSDPRALASCICVKDGNLDAASSAVESSVSYYCGSSSFADITSAHGVLDYYCSAAKALVTPAGVTATVTSTGGGGKGTSTLKSGATATSTRASSTATTTPQVPSGGGPDPTTSATISGVPVAAIAGGVGGAAIFVIFMLFVFYRYRRRKRNNPKPPPMAGDPNNPSSPPPDYSQVELSGNPVNRTPLRKPVGNVVYSPVSPVDQPDVAELTPAERRQQRRDLHIAAMRPHLSAAELGGNTPNNARRHEVGGSTQNPAEIGPASARSGPWYEMHVP